MQVWGKDGQKQTGWALLRASLHDPLIVINAESDEKGGASLAPQMFNAITGAHTRARLAAC
jgi:phosphomannomutase